MAGILRWEDPPPCKRVSAETGALVAELKAHPGQWAVIREGAKSVSSIREALRKHGCDASSRRHEDGSFTLWAQWPVDGPKPTNGRAARRAKVVDLPEPTPVKRESAAEPPRAGDKALRCEDCDFTTEVGMAMHMARHTKATHGRSPLTIEKTPRTAREAL